MKGKWRNGATAVIRKVMTDNPGLSEKELRKLISAEYPFGERRMHPYKIWCDEVNRQLGKKKKIKGTKIENQLTLL